MVNFLLAFRVSSGALSGVATSNRRSRTQYSAQRSSMAIGSYAFGSSWLIGALRVASTKLHVERYSRVGRLHGTSNTSTQQPSQRLLHAKIAPRRDLDPPFVAISLTLTPSALAYKGHVATIVPA